MCLRAGIVFCEALWKPQKLESCLSVVCCYVFFFGFAFRSNFGRFWSRFGSHLAPFWGQEASKRDNKSKQFYDCVLEWQKLRCAQVLRRLLGSIWSGRSTCESRCQSTGYNNGQNSCQSMSQSMKELRLLVLSRFAQNLKEVPFWARTLCSSSKMSTYFDSCRNLLEIRRSGRLQSLPVVEVAK